jgi:AraC-like DNA-binding protein
MSRRKKTIIEYRHYSLPLNFPVLLLSGERWRISDKKSGRLHFHNCLEIGICHSDSGIMDFEDVPIPFRAGDVTCVPKHLPHTTYSSPGTESLWSYIFVDPEELFRNMFNNQSAGFDKPMSTNRNYHLIMNKEDYPKVYFLASSIVDELRNQRTSYQSSVRGLMLSLYVELLRIHAKDDTIKDAKKEIKQDHENVLVILNALDHIHNNYMQPICIDDLADLCHLSVSHFRRTFHEIMGAAPLDFLNSTRIDEACWLLRSTEDSILTISEKVGFHSISSFNRCFIKLMEVPPSVWRKQMLLSETNSPKASILEFSGWI